MTKEELNKKAVTEETDEEIEEEDAEMEENETVENENENKENVVHLPVQQKRGFWRDLGIGAKIGVGLVFTGIGVGIGLLVKGLLGGKDEPESSEAIPAEGTVSEPAE